MLNLQIPFLYRFEAYETGPVHINTMDIIYVTNYSSNSNWSTIQMRNGESYIALLSPEEFAADILNSYNQIMKVYK